MPVNHTPIHFPLHHVYWNDTPSTFTSINKVTSAMKEISINEDGVQLLQRILGLATPSPEDQDVLLIAIDFENVQAVPRHKSMAYLHTQLGFATFDTMSLATEPEPTISTHNYIVGSLAYYLRTSARYLFGKSTITLKHKLPSIIESMIPTDRKVILVGHHISGDLRALFSLNPKIKTYPSIVGVLDTEVIAKQLFGSMEAIQSVEECGLGINGYEGIIGELWEVAMEPLPNKPNIEFGLPDVGSKEGLSFCDIVCERREMRRKKRRMQRLARLQYWELLKARSERESMRAAEVLELRAFYRLQVAAGL
ncbi:hypothetical protein TWF694_002501 [Orbilia ellipsospora]|uniref:Gfd2/YDR514C-like C-terminal domain-containing protein n=1 Tax=Orbilia ellipsospora TaxID=2528407 RepID=A0AAV9X4R1_9PEZI